MLIDIHSHQCTREPDVFRIHSVSAWKSLKGAGFEFAGMGISAGVHPWEASCWHDAEQEALREVLSLPEVMMVGEIGLDKVCQAPFDLQLAVFQFQLEVAAACGKPVVLHVVKAMGELLAQKKKTSGIPAWIIHGFRGNSKTAARYLAAGFYLSFGKYYQLESLRLCPVDRLLLETDEGGDIRALYDRVAESRGVRVDALEASIEQNMSVLFPQFPMDSVRTACL